MNRAHWTASYRAGPSAGSNSFSDWPEAANWLAQQVTIPLSSMAALLKGVGDGRTITVRVGHGHSITLSPPNARPEKVDLLGILDREMDGWEAGSEPYERLATAKLGLTDLFNTAKAVIPMVTEACSGPDSPLRQDGIARRDAFTTALFRLLP